MMSIVPDDFLIAVRSIVPNAGPYFASLLYHRGWRDLAFLAGWVDADRVVRSVPNGLMAKVERVRSAIDRGDRIVVWGDRSMDSIATVAVLVEGLGVSYEIGEFTNAEDDAFVIVYGSGEENDRVLYLEPYSELMNGWAGVAIGFGILERLAGRSPLAPLGKGGTGEDIKNAEAELKVPLSKGDLGGSVRPLLDIVAIGLLADPTIEMNGEHRYLIQKGIRQLQLQENPKTSTRPGLQRLLEHCKQLGDRPTDHLSGIGPRMAAMSQIQQDGRVCVELLVTRDRVKAQQLADLTELANVRRRGLQREVMDEVMRQVGRLDWSMVSVIVLSDPQWEVGVLGWVAEELVEIYDRPVMVFNTGSGVARGVARSGGTIDFQSVLRSQQHLIMQMNPNPYAVDFTIALEDLQLFTEAITHQFNLLKNLPQSPPLQGGFRGIDPDLCVTVSELNQSLYNDLRLLEPYGRGNPIPRILVKDVWFEAVKNFNLRDRKNQMVSYIRSHFKMCDASDNAGIHGVWWGHYQDELIGRRGDAIVYLINNRKERRYEVRLVGFGDLVLGGDRGDARDMGTASHAPTGNYGEDAGDLILRLIGRAKYAARSGEAIDDLLDGIPEICHGMAIAALMDLGFEITQPDPRKPSPHIISHPLYGHGSPCPNPTAQPSQTTIAQATHPLLLALQEIQFQQQYLNAPNAPHKTA